jgi:uncharacterized protein YndB with AHSA1/START domain
MKQQRWRLNNKVEVLINTSVERLWAALTEAADTERYFMGARVTVGEVGQGYRLERDDGWLVTGTVLVKKPMHRLRVTWHTKTPASLAMPDCEVEYLIEPSDSLRSGLQAKLIVSEYVDGPASLSLGKASRTGWVMITRNLKAYLDRRLPPLGTAQNLTE